MDRTNLFFKVVVEHDAGEQAERLGREICQKLLKVYGVRSAEMTSHTPAED
jgi:hypothetical protein